MDHQEASRYAALIGVKPPAPDDFEARFAPLLRANDVDGIARLLSTYPEVARDPAYSGTMLWLAAQCGNIPVLSLLVERGADVNTHSKGNPEHRPLYAAVLSNAAGAVRWLLRRGAVVNWGWEGARPYCVPLWAAINYNHGETVRLLVDAGADVNAIDGFNRTALDWAVEVGDAEIADYLRSRGALRTHLLPGRWPSDLGAALVAFTEWAVEGSEPLSLPPPGPDEAAVVVRAARTENYLCLFTQGMSARAMDVPPGGEAYRHAELALYHPDWMQEYEDVARPESLWLVRWMRRIAARPLGGGTWLGGRTAVIANGEPPQPLSEYTAMTCWLLLADKEPLSRFMTGAGKEVFFYTLLPIHTAERDFEREHGTAALLQRFVENNVPVEIDYERRSCV